MYSMAAMADEMEKLAAHTVQKTRSGSMPIRVHKLTEKEVYDRSKTKTSGVAEMAAGATKAAPGILSKSKLTKPLVTGALTIGAWEAMRRANQDRKLGRQMRVQQGMY